MYKQMKCSYGNNYRDENLSSNKISEDSPVDLNSFLSKVTKIFADKEDDVEKWEKFPVSKPKETSKETSKEKEGFLSRWSKPIYFFLGMSIPVLCHGAFYLTQTTSLEPICDLICK